MCTRLSYIVYVYMDTSALLGAETDTEAGMARGPRLCAAQAISKVLLQASLTSVSSVGMGGLYLAAAYAWAVQGATILMQPCAPCSHLC